MIDDRCHHCITACSKNAFGMKIHHATAIVIKELAQTAGFRAKTEEIGLFNQEYQGLLSEKEKRFRPDVTIRDVPGPYRNIILDVSNTRVVPISGNVAYTREQATTPEIAAQRRYEEKMAKYDQPAQTVGLKFFLIIFENTGRMHSKSLLVIESLLKNMSGYKDGALLKAYWLSRISCSFQQQVGRHIIDKLRKQKGQRFTQGHFENRPEYALEYEFTAVNST